MPVKNIIFDLGGVLLNIDYMLTQKAFEDLGVQDAGGVYSQAAQRTLFDDFETGRINTVNFLEGLKEFCPNGVSSAQLQEAWNAMLLDFPAHRLTLLHRMKERYRIFLLSNTNAIHFEGFNRIILEQHGIDNFASLFHKAYYSHELGMRKPDAEIFEWVLKDQGLAKEETVFIDDSIQHVEGAQTTGLKALFKDAGRDVTEVLDEAGIG